MNDFTRCFQIGLTQGAFGGMFGFNNWNFNSGCCSNPFVFGTPTPMFFTPSFNFFNTYQYSNPMVNVPFMGLTPIPRTDYSWDNNSVWSNNINIPNFSTAPDWNKIQGPVGGFDWQNIQLPSSTNNSENKKETEDITVGNDFNAKELKSKWNNKCQKTAHLPEEFFKKIISISKKLDCDPSHLMAVINLETAGTFKASIQNPRSKATGLIQFMPKTATNMGTSIEKLANMSEVEQLDYVEKYLLDRKKERKIKGRVDATTLYCLIFWPDAANKENNYLIANQKNKNTGVYNDNKGLDYNKDKSITRGDLDQRVKEFMA